MASKTGGPAFPSPLPTSGNWVDAPLPEHSGMTLRDWFAGQVLAARAQFGGDPFVAAQLAYQYADAMLAARQK